jgi:CRP/FNR family cyclic AMP-dependent transcriptional regulator
LTTRPHVTLDLLELALARLRAADARQMEFATSATLARLAGPIVELAQRFVASAGQGVIEVGLPISQQELAAWSGCSRESTARALRELSLIETARRRLVVLDLDALRATRRG